MKKSVLTLLLGSSLSLLSMTSFAAPQQPYLETTGIGEVEVKPDMADINIAISISKPTAQEAKDASDEAIISLLKRLNTMQVAREDIKSANISLYPNYSYPKNAEPKLIGYKANRSVTITVRDLKNLNDLLDGALADGLNKISGINLRSSKEAELKEQARSKAIEDAINKANALAHGFNQKISGVWNIRYNSNHIARPMMLRMEAKAASADMGYVDSKINIKDQVDVTFTLNGNNVVYQPIEK